MRYRNSPKARPVAFPQEFFSSREKHSPQSTHDRSKTLMRRLSVAAGVALVALAFAAASRVADTREGLIAEVVTLFSGLAGVGLLLYGLTSGRGPRRRPATSETKLVDETTKARNANDLVLGGAGLVLAIALVIGLALSGGAMWAGFGAVMLLPMAAGSVYLCARFIRSPTRTWRIDLRRRDR